MSYRNDDLGYPIVVAQDVRDDVHEFIQAKNYKRIIVLADAQPEVVRVAKRIARGVPGAARIVPVRLGERRKRLRTVETVLSALLDAGADRTTPIIGVGGGVASDLFGFAAAMFMRGVPYVHVATSLVAMVDAAIGGKTGVDLDGGKNLAGVFRDPRAVFCDIRALRTLPAASVREGLAEMVKHAIIEGDDLYERMENLAPHPLEKWPWEEIVADSLRVKVMIVADDRTEQGLREVLNLGHTFAHGFERASNYRITHGAAVSLGLRAAGLLALRTGRFSQKDYLRVLSLLALLRLPMQLPKTVLPRAVLAAMQSDKKKRDGKLRFVLPSAIGDVEYGITVSDPVVRAVLKQLAIAPSEAELTQRKRRGVARARRV